MKEDNKKIKEYIAKKVNKVLKDKGITSMTDVVVSPNIVFYWRPNNYRIKIPYKPKKHYNKRTLSSYGIKISNYGTKFTKKSERTTLMVDIPKKKRLGNITVIHSLKREKQKMWYEVTGMKLKDIDSKIDDRVNKIKRICLKEAKKFVKKFNGFLYINQAKWIRNEDAIKGEDFIDEIDPNMIIHDTYFKKVYKDTVEFKSPAFVKKYIGNRVVEEIAPELRNDLLELKSGFNELNKSLSIYNKNIEKNTEATLLEIKNKKIHLGVLKSMNTTLKAIRKDLRSKKKVKEVKIPEFQTKLGLFENV